MAVIAYESAEDIKWLDEEYLDTSDVPVAEPDNNREEEITVITTFVFTIELTVNVLDWMHSGCYLLYATVLYVSFQAAERSMIEVTLLTCALQEQ